MLLIQVPDSANASQEVSLDGNKVKLITRWNDVAGQWSLDVYIENEPKRIGIVMSPNREITAPYTNLNESLGGAFYCLRLSNEDTPLDRQAFIDGGFVLGFQFFEE